MIRSCLSEFQTPIRGANFGAPFKVPCLGELSKDALTIHDATTNTNLQCSVRERASASKIIPRLWHRQCQHYAASRLLYAGRWHEQLLLAVDPMQQFPQIPSLQLYHSPPPLQLHPHDHNLGLASAPHTSRIPPSLPSTTSSVSAKRQYQKPMPTNYAPSRWGPRGGKRHTHAFPSG